GDIQSVTLRVIADGQGKRQCILDDYRVTTDVGFFADAAELMHTGIRADVRAIFDHDMSGKRGCVCHDDAIADQAIVRDVCLGHNQAVVDEASQHAAAGSASMNGYEFAYLVALADACFGRLAFVLQILRSKADGDEGKCLGAGADRCVTVDDAVRFESDAVAKLNVIADDAIRSNEAVVAD